MSAGPEYDKVERPFVDQLSSMPDDEGRKLWKWTTGNLDYPSATGRTSFKEVLLLDDLRKALRAINHDQNGDPWLDDDRISTAVSALERLGKHKLMEANEAATTLLLKGIPVEGLPGWDGGRSQTVNFIDWEHPERNTFRAINQFRVNEPGGQAHEFINPDIVLFVNGIPLVVVECKAPNISEPITQAIDQIQRYSNQRHWLEGNEGNEKLFHYNTIGASSVHYLEWKDTSPVPLADVAAIMGKTHLSSQEKLVAGALRPAHLLDIVRHFAVFDSEGGKTIKKVCRYQQFRAVHAAVDRLKTGKTLAEDGEHDRRGGLIWHTQGSGKSLTMVFMVKKMRSDPGLRTFKVVMVTDRKSLQDQLSSTLALTGETPTVIKPRTVGFKTISSVDVLKETLALKGPDLVFAMIQKYQEQVEGEEPEEVDIDADDASIKDTADDGELFPVLNEDESIVVMVDEAHRSHGSTLHANLLNALPNCARIGFTGTPIIMGKKKRTHAIFGEFIDRYTIKQSEADGSTLPILYEGRTTEGAVKHGRDLDDVFEDMFRSRTPEELEAIKAKYATKGHVLEAKRLIQAKARDMLRHYVEFILPNGFKAQVVAFSRRATVRFHKAFLEAQAELVAELEGMSPDLLHLTDEEIAGLPKRTQFLTRARRYLDRIRDLEFAPVFSSAHNDPPEWQQWSDKSKVKRRIANFKKPFEHEDPKKRSNLAFLIVKSMLITGFDAPVAQVQYLDRGIKEAELLQAIARVNRTKDGKRAGIVVDYYGIARHLKEALAAYSAEDVDGALQSLKDEIPKLRDRHHRAVAVFTDVDLELDDEEGCIEHLRDERIRADFTVKLKQFLSTLDLVLPRPEGLPYIKDARKLGTIAIRARNRYRDDTLRPMGKDIGEKVRALIDEHVISLGIDPKIPPVSILDQDFEAHVGKQRSSRAQASEMEHALRWHIRKHLNEDPEHFKKLSERLDLILKELKERWDELVGVLRELVVEARTGREADQSGLDPETQAPFLGVLKLEAFGEVEVPIDELRRLAEITVELVDHIQQEVRLVGFWSNDVAQEVLRKWVVAFLDEFDILPLGRLDAVSVRIVELAKANHHKLVR